MSLDELIAVAAQAVLEVRATNDAEMKAHEAARAAEERARDARRAVERYITDRIATAMEGR